MATTLANTSGLLGSVSSHVNSSDNHTQNQGHHGTTGSGLTNREILLLSFASLTVFIILVFYSLYRWNKKNISTKSTFKSGLLMRRNHSMEFFAESIAASTVTGVVVPGVLGFDGTMFETHTNPDFLPP
uniref:Uncharacterized LOC101243025 n=1 Tax=Ciona intestinalis TaxID=7719 RepID=H2XTK1_CIOIN|nr:uncharacterized protein LOC101243025 [Ciona intestinalis]|eukprot:XP_004226649.1 uncharacterized protein LOC101243025 [Ciona intestinalis]